MLDKRYLIKGKDETLKIHSCSYSLEQGSWEVIFKSNPMKYCYSSENIEMLQLDTILEPKNYKIWNSFGEIYGIVKLILYISNCNDRYYWIKTENRKTNSEKEWLYSEQELVIEQSVLENPAVKNIFNYLNQLANFNGLQGDDGEKLLAKQYSNLKYISPNTVLSHYLNPVKNRVSEFSMESMLFPFGCNGSQFLATKRALENQISIIQGPPGTGKTQTILNILANIVAEGKTVLVVSNNNEAIKNIQEKLADKKYGLDFLVAFLGNKENKKQFLNGQKSVRGNLLQWQIDTEISFDSFKTVHRIFNIQEEMAKLKAELSQLQLEKSYFDAYITFNTTEIIDLKRLPSKRVLELWWDCERIYHYKKGFPFLFKMKSFIKYGIYNWKFYKQDIVKLTPSFQVHFYKKRQKELEGNLSILQKEYSSLKGDEILKTLQINSLKQLQSILIARYKQMGTRQIFDGKELRSQSQKFLKEYPIILSTTFSAKTSLNQDVIYDYLIIDEASQVDITTGALALSCAKNVVVVGDTKQLPHIVTTNTKKQAESIFNKSKFPEGYRYTNSFLESMLNIFPDAPVTLLKEHYRCHPKIIQFCNQKFYDDALVVMTEDTKQDSVLHVLRTNKGNHSRDKYSQREIDIIKDDVFMNYNIDEKDVAIVVPYRNQATALGEQIKVVDSDTVHKFQGREKKDIIISTVDDRITQFTDDPQLLNVAISRAKERLFLVMTGNEQSPTRNISDLLGYITYQNGEVRESPIYSIFDYLYKHYEATRKNFLNKKRTPSKYVSENLMLAVIDEVIKEKYPQLNAVHGYPMRELIKDTTRLNESEIKYAQHFNTHIDFVIFNRVSDKQPILAIEVDGYKFHKKGTKQEKRDVLKNSILNKYNIPLLRFATNGSQEKKRLIEMLDYILDKEN